MFSPPTRSEYNRATLTGRTISHYRITEKLGKAGMGVAYRAEDTKLERNRRAQFLAAYLLNDAEAGYRSAAVLKGECPRVRHWYGLAREIACGRPAFL